MFDGPLILCDWGVMETKGKNKNKNDIGLRKTLFLCSWYRPDVLVVEDYEGKGSRKGKRVKSLIDMIVMHASSAHTPIAKHSRSQIRQCFASLRAVNKYEIATQIVTRLPELKGQLPPKRKIWKPEDRRMSIFDAVSLAVCYFNLGVIASDT
ncbi:MAG: hypothetical protein IIA72_11710 [Proteobacteria bacterium]|nr:hypothetical protein [Pseudomonadota bacterium]